MLPEPLLHLVLIFLLFSQAIVTTLDSWPGWAAGKGARVLRGESPGLPDPYLFGLLLSSLLLGKEL